MKWIKFEDEMDSSMKNAGNLFQKIPPIYKKGKKVVAKSFSKNTSAMLQQKLNKKFVEWVTYPNSRNPTLPNLGPQGRRKYELFCGGFLYYHDIVFKKYPEGGGYEYPKPQKAGIPAKWKEYPSTEVAFEHMIFFEWLPKGKGVRIYINQTPTAFNSNPPKPPGPPPPES